MFSLEIEPHHFGEIRDVTDCILRIFNENNNEFKIQNNFVTSSEIQFHSKIQSTKMEINKKSQIFFYKNKSHDEYITDYFSKEEMTACDIVNLFFLDETFNQGISMIEGELLGPYKYKYLSNIEINPLHRITLENAV